jgi:beta-glucosidase
MRKLLPALLIALLAVAPALPGQTRTRQRRPPIPHQDAPLQNPDDAAAALVARMTTAEKLQLVHGALTIENPNGPSGAQEFVPGISRLGIPDLRYSDGPVGPAAPLGQGTALPSSIACAATWDTDAAYRYSNVIGAELKAYGMNVWLGANVNLSGREPRGGRTFETAGEDPLLAGLIKAAQIRAVQDLHLIGTLKHYALNDQETGRIYSNLRIGDRAARQSDLLAFEIALTESNAQSVMCSYNLVNGAYACGHDSLLNGILKGDWAFPGFVASDAFAAPGAAPAALAGLDQEQIGGYMFGGVWGPGLDSALQNGELPMARLDDMVRRILRAMFATGMIGDTTISTAIDAAAGAAVAQQVLEQGAVLLKNGGPLLPLDASRIASIAVIGSHADVGVLSGGGSAQVTPIGGAALALPPDCPASAAGTSGLSCHNASMVFVPSSPLAAIRAKAPAAVVRFGDGADPAAAAALAASSTVAIVFVSVWTSEGMDLDSLTLPNGQDALVQAVAAANPRTIVVVESGGPVTMPWLDRAGAVLAVWYPGQRGGEAIANLLFGDVNPSGKLPVTFPRAVADLPRPAISAPADPSAPKPFDVDYSIDGFNVGYKWYDAQSIEPLFPFGYGLSYTVFALSQVQLQPSRDPAAPGFELAFELQNTGARDGAEVVQVYLALPVAAADSPKRLVAWRKVALASGETQAVKIGVAATDTMHPLSFWNPNSQSWELASGDYTVYVGNSSRNLAVAGKFTWPLPADGSLVSGRAVRGGN